MNAPQVSTATMAERTQDAYSYDRYARWSALPTMLRLHGLDDRQQEAVLRSKWTRWAADASDRPYGHATSKDLERWMDAGNYWAQVPKLTAEHFGEPEAHTPTPHQYGFGSRLSAAYTAGRNGQECPRDCADKSSHAYRAWKDGRDEARKLNSHAALVAAVKRALETSGMIRGRDQLVAALAAAEAQS